ncbi:MAG: Mini-ribonuclease 3 [Clostridia bacterium]|nr:Mini-ribonuclease 3 [Clostridia bacterium]
MTKTLNETEAGQINPVVLAFLGDAVYSLWIRERLVCSGAGKAADFQRAAGRLVSAKGQSAFLERVLPTLTERETEIFKRGRNAKKATKSKHASVAEYNRSTGFEAVLGYLYLIGARERIEVLLSHFNAEELQGQAAQTPYKP